MERVPAAIPWHDASPSRFAGQLAGRVRAVVHRPRRSVPSAAWPAGSCLRPGNSRPPSRHVVVDRKARHRHDRDEVYHLAVRAKNVLHLPHQRGRVRSRRVDQDRDIGGQAQPGRQAAADDRVHARNPQLGRGSEADLPAGGSGDRVAVAGGQPEPARGGPARDELTAGQPGPDPGRRRRRGRRPGPEGPRRDAEHAGRPPVDHHLAAVHGQHRPYSGQPADSAHLRGGEAGGQHREQVRHHQLARRRAGYRTGCHPAPL